MVFRFPKMRSLSFSQDEIASDNGAVYLFERSGEVWNQKAKLFPSSSNSSLLFGQVASLNSNFSIVGSHHEGKRTK